jgi:hypothetical protein
VGLDAGVDLVDRRPAARDELRLQPVGAVLLAGEEVQRPALTLLCCCALPREACACRRRLFSRIVFNNTVVSSNARGSSRLPRRANLCRIVFNNTVMSRSTGSSSKLPRRVGPSSRYMSALMYMRM